MFSCFDSCLYPPTEVIDQQCVALHLHSPPLCTSRLVLSVGSRSPVRGGAGNTAPATAVSSAAAAWTQLIRTATRSVNSVRMQLTGGRARVVVLEETLASSEAEIAALRSRLATARVCAVFLLIILDLLACSIIILDLLACSTLLIYSLAHFS